MEVLLDQPELSQVPNKSQRLLQAKFDFIIMQLFTYLLCFKKSIVWTSYIWEKIYPQKLHIKKNMSTALFWVSLTDCHQPFCSCILSFFFIFFADAAAAQYVYTH